MKLSDLKTLTPPPTDETPPVSNQNKEHFKEYVSWLEKEKGFKGADQLDKYDLSGKTLNEFIKANPKTTISKDIVFQIQNTDSPKAVKGAVDNDGHPIPTSAQLKQNPYIYDDGGKGAQILQKYSGMNGDGTGQPAALRNSLYSKHLNNIQYLLNNWSDQSPTPSTTYRPENNQIADNYKITKKTSQSNNYG